MNKTPTTLIIMDGFGMRDDTDGNAVLQALAHADDGMQASFQGGMDLLIDGDISLTEVLAALRVADDDILHAQVLEHIGRHLASVRRYRRTGR